MLPSASNISTGLFPMLIKPSKKAYDLASNAVKSHTAFRFFYSAWHYYPEYYPVESNSELKGRKGLQLNTGAAGGGLMDMEDNNPALKTEPGMLKGKNFLLVEDNRLNQRLAISILDKWEVKVDLAVNGAEALQMLGSKAYDLVLMDIHMPILDGYEATLMIRNQMPEPVKRVPIIALTANAIKGFREECLKAGMNDFITKPYSQQALYAKCLRALNASESEKVSQASENEPKGAAAQATDSLTDLTYLRDFSGDDTEFIKEMVTIFLERCAEDLPVITKAIADAEYLKIRDLVHRIKPTIAFMGINSIKDEVQECEDLAGESTGLERISLLYAKIERVCIESMNELRVFLASVTE